MTLDDKPAMEAVLLIAKQALLDRQQSQRSSPSLLWPSTWNRGTWHMCGMPHVWRASLGRAQLHRTGSRILAHAQAGLAGELQSKAASDTPSSLSV